MRRIMMVYGTRPEAIKMGPVVRALAQSQHLEPVVVLTGQHRELLKGLNELFDVRVDSELDVFSPGQSLARLTSQVLTQFEKVLTAKLPDAVMVQGDTTSAFAAALGAFYQQVPVFHLEAGLRTATIRSPFPEESNRRLVSRIADLHFAPTSGSKENLLSEGVASETVVTTGNTVIDALIDVTSRAMPFEEPKLVGLERTNQELILVTAHRRESWGEPMGQIGKALKQLALQRPDTRFVLPLHANPIVREPLTRALGKLPNVILTDALSYPDFSRLLRDCTLVITDSGGVQEEAPAFGKPVLVLRENTERPEALDAGTVKLIGTKAENIVQAVQTLLGDKAEYTKMARAVNPYGDGHASRRVVSAIEAWFGLAKSEADFDPKSLLIPAK